jgi:hypothetical protein
MNLNNISLPPQLVVDLYQHSLVEGTATTVPQTPAVPSLGKGGKGILIVVNKPDAPFLPDINWSKAPHQNTEAIMEQFNANAVILFEVDPALFELPHDLPMFAVHILENRKYVAAPALKEIEKTKEAKGQLWMALKQLFGI